MTVSYSFDNTFIGIDMAGASFEVAWHRGGGARYANRPDAIACFLQRLGEERLIGRIAIEPTGGYEKPLVTALRGAGLPVEVVHTSRFAAYRALVGSKAKSDTSDARLLASYAAAPDEIRGKAGHVVLADDAERQELAGLAARRDQIKHMIYAETCRLATAHPAVRESIREHLEGLKDQDRKLHDGMKALVRRRDDLKQQKRLLQTIKGVGDKTALACLAMLPELGRVSNKAAAALVGVAPFVRSSGTFRAPARILGGRAPLRSIFYMAAVTASQHNPVLKPFYDRLVTAGKPIKLALIAVMRRLVVFANAVLRSNQPWRGLQTLDT